MFGLDVVSVYFVKEENPDRNKDQRINPENINDPDMSGVVADFHIVLNKIYTSEVPELTDDYVVPANATYREHIYEIAVGATAYGITGAEGVKWADGTPPEVEANTTVVVSVINNLAVWGTFREDEA